MKKFIRDLIVVCLCVIVAMGAIVGAIQSLPPQFSDTYDASAIDKYALLKSTKSPKIVMIAGSNFAFGLDSAKIEEAFGMPVVNMGLHSGIKPHFNLAMVKENLGKGDVVVIGLEYEEYGPRKIDVPTALQTVENYPELWRFISPLDYPRIFKGYLSDYGFLKIDRYRNGYEPQTGVYARNVFNSYGDIEYPRPESIRDEVEPDVEMDADEIDSHVIKEYNRFYRYAKKKGASVYLTFPSLDEKALESSEEEQEEFIAELDKRLEIPVISDYHTYVMSSDLFYNTDYHLNDKGREIRTQNLIQDMKEVIK